MRRSTPCVDGCCGPMLMIMVSSSGRSMSMSEASTPWLSGSRSTDPTSRSSSSGGRVVARGELLGPFEGLAHERGLGVGPRVAGVLAVASVVVWLASFIGAPEPP